MRKLTHTSYMGNKEAKKCQMYFFQDERFMHLSAEEISTVETCVNQIMGWMNNMMNAQSKLAITQEPIVKVADIIAKMQVCEQLLHT